MEYNWLLALIPGLPLLGAAVVAIGAYNNWKKTIPVAIGCTTVFISFIATVAARWQFGTLASGETLHMPLWSWGVDGVGLGLLGDSVSFWFALVVTGVGFLIHLYSAAYMADDPGYPRFFAKLNFFIFAMSLLVLADGFVGLTIGWGTVAIASWSLIGFWHAKPEAAAAARKAFWVNMVGEVGLILGAVVIYTHFSSLSYDGVLPFADTVAPEALNAIVLLLLVGGVAKSAQLPLHVWLPDAMQGPTPVSALIHAATMVTAGVYLAVRVHPLFAAAPVGMTAVAVVGIASVLFGALAALGQNDIKRILAFSTMSQVGYMILAAGVGAYSAALFHFATHAFFKALLFLGAGVVINRFGGEQDIRRMGGLGRHNPVVYWTFLIGTLALVGLPPLSGFYSKDVIVVEALMQGHPWLWALGIVGGALTAFYMLRLFSLVFTGADAQGAARDADATDAAAVGGEEDAVGIDSPATGGAAGEAEHDPIPALRGRAVPLLKAVPLFVLTVLAAVGGFLPLPEVWVPGAPGAGPAGGSGGAAAEATLGNMVLTEAQVSNWTMVLLLVVSVLAGGWALAAFGPRRRPTTTAGAFASAAGKGFYFDDAYRALFVRPLALVAQLVGNIIDPHVVDGIVNGTARLVGTLSVAVRRLHRGYVRRYALVLMAGVTLVLLYFVIAF